MVTIRFESLNPVNNGSYGHMICSAWHYEPCFRDLVKERGELEVGDDSGNEKNRSNGTCGMYFFNAELFFL